MAFIPPSDLCSLLPPGLAVGPSQHRLGRLGLWWVGRPLEAGAVLGTSQQTDGSEEEKTLMETTKTWIRFACQARSPALGNAAVRCTCGQVCEGACPRGVAMCARQDIQPGSELLVWNDDQRPESVANAETFSQGKAEQIEDQEEADRWRKRRQKGSDSVPADGLPAVRSSSRLAAKPRRVHGVTNRVKRSAALNPEEESRSSSEAGGRERRYRCSTCGKKFYQIGHLKKHRFSHTEEKPFTCADCGKSYTSTESFRAHQMSHRGERPFRCPHCDKAYGLKRDLKEHLVLHSGEKPYGCQHCGKSFARRPSLRVHRLLHCSSLSHTQTPKVQCSVCSKLLANSNSLRNHMKLHNGEKPHVCPHCGKAFTQKGNLDTHLRTHSGDRPFSCSDCPQTFSQKTDLQRHMFSHNGGGFLCSHCGKSLRDPHSLRSHERLHTGERPHTCLVCGKGYTLATKLRRHLKSAHQKEKPFVCHCGATFSVQQSLQRHQNQHAEAGDHQKPARGRPRKPPHQGADSGDVQVVYLQAQGPAEPELVEVVISEGAQQCIVVQRENDQTVGELLILQDRTFCPVAQTVEIV